MKALLPSRRGALRGAGAVLALVAGLGVSCGGKGGDGSSGTVPLTLPADVAWLSTGIQMSQLKNIEIRGTTPNAAGLLVTVEEDPIPFLGHRRLLGRLGLDGRPFDVGPGTTLNGDTFNEGETLYLGRNDLAYVTTAALGGAIDPVGIDLEVVDSNGVPLLAPENGIWSNNAQPTFTWENLERASQYVLVISRFPDFRTVEQSTTVQTSGTTNIATAPGTPASSTPNAALTEGLHYWRVRAQVNPCRDLNPCFVWKDWSLTFTYGVELGNALPGPTYLSPATDAIIEVDTPAIVEFTSQPSPSGALWRFRSAQTPCGGSPTINSKDPASGNPTPWMVFPGTYASPDPQQPPLLYGSYETDPLASGEWLFRVEVRKASDFQAQNVSSADLQLSIGCQ